MYLLKRVSKWSISSKACQCWSCIRQYPVRIHYCFLVYFIYTENGVSVLVSVIEHNSLFNNSASRLSPHNQIYTKNTFANTRIAYACNKR